MNVSLKGVLSRVLPFLALMCLLVAMLPSIGYQESTLAPAKCLTLALVSVLAWVGLSLFGSADEE